MNSLGLVAVVVSSTMDLWSADIFSSELIFNGFVGFFKAFSKFLQKAVHKFFGAPLSKSD